MGTGNLDVLATDQSYQYSLQYNKALFGLKSFKHEFITDEMGNYLNEMLGVAG